MIIGDTIVVCDLLLMYVMYYVEKDMNQWLKMMKLMLKSWKTEFLAKNNSIGRPIKATCRPEDVTCRRMKPKIA